MSVLPTSEVIMIKKDNVIESALKVILSFVLFYLALSYLQLMLKELTLS